MSPPSRARYGVLVPVKPTRHAKSRLAPLGDAAREALVEAFAADTVSAALSSPAVALVMAVTDDHVLAAGLAELGAHVLPDGAAGDLNATLVQASAELHRRWPDLALAALCADLPALDTAELTAALDCAAEHTAAIVPDTAGTGTTLVTAASTEHFHPRFGPGSRQEHVNAGAHLIHEVAVPTLRRDVDTPEDLEAALLLGVGPRTAMVAAGLAGPSSGRTGSP
jgi:2-phospho-L-lactate guanylyltransferase